MDDDFRLFMGGLSGLGGWGVADVAGLHPLADAFPRAVSLIVPYGPLAEYSEAAYNSILAESKERVDALCRGVVDFLDAHGARAMRGGGPMDPDTLLGGFPHKLAAVRAGLGWIGRNCLFVMEGYGPRVRLATVLTDALLEPGLPVTADKCGDCRACVDACPYGCLTGAGWKAGMAREELIDVVACSSKRLDDGVRRLGRKDDCGLCLWSCPVK